MTYYININPSNIKDFLQIIKSLKNLGVVNSFGSVGYLAREGDAVTEEELLSVLDYASKEAEAGNALSLDEVKKQVKGWSKE